MTSVTVHRTVTLPETIEKEWITAPSDATQKSYTTYYHKRKLLPESEGYLSWLGRGLAKGVIGAVQSTAFVFSGWTGFGVSTLTRNDVIYRGGAEVAQMVHAYWVAGTRVPVDHDRTDRAIETIRRIEKCQNADDFIKRIQQIYTKWLMASKGSANLMKVLASDTDTATKMDAIVTYLLRPVELRGFEKLRYNNGKELNYTIVLLAEKAKIT